MDISVKKLSEILKIDPNALLEKMIAAGLPQKDIEDLVSTEDKQTLLSYIRSSKDSPVQEKKVEVPKETIRKEIVYVPLPTDDEDLLKKGPFNAPNYDKDKKK